MIEIIAAVGAAIAIAAPIVANESDAWILASMTVGETGLLFGKVGNAERWVMWAVRNRMASDDYPNGLWAVIEQGFYGYRRGLEPSAAMLVLAEKVLSAAPEDDPTDGCLYVMSGDDMRMHGWDPTPAIRVMRGGRWELYFFREMPE